MSMAVYPGRRSSSTARAVGRYELKEKLGEGGMGVVWRALDSRIGGDVALKIMKDVSDPAALELFSKEWRALAEMSHPNIVDVRDVDVLVEDGEQKPFFVMPLLRGATLSDLIKGSSERLTVGRVVEILSQVCRGLQAAHQRGLVHRDLKPSNIFVMDDDTAKVIDFGVVYLAGSNSMTGLKGTYQYMSPEQVLMKDVTPASDLFALGVILYEALTSRKPFACATPEETIQAVQKRIPPPVSELNPAIPHAISQVVHKCLAKQAIHRFSSARDLADALQRAARGEVVFPPEKLKLRIERVKAALKQDEGFASELLQELESEGHLDPEITVLRGQIDMTMTYKKIRQLMESARARIEQDEIALGLDKLRELLELDPGNAEALALKAATEKKRSEAQAERWVQLATTHLENCDFAAARHAVQEALASRPQDMPALDLLGRIESMETEAKRAREQKEHLYSTAMKAYQNGEIDSALSRMVRLFSVVRQKPEGAVPERDAVYESFYQQVRSEHDSIRLLLEEAQHEFSEENFSGALELCAKHLATYPHDGVFQALKIQVEDAERQKVSSYIAMVTKNADAEPDLDRRANILREASERYPGEAQFAQQLKVVRERRDLVNSIVAKARQFGERGQYSEELSQWDMLRNIHPRYPGLAFELEQCRKKRDKQAQDEEKAHLVEEIVRLMDQRDYARSLEQTRLALLEFAGDAELVGLEKLSQEGLERCQEAQRLYTEGQAQASVSNWVKSTESLRQALKLDPRNVAIKEGLVNVLTEQARELLETDWMTAQRLHEEASALDRNHRAVRMLGTEVSEARRQTFVGECLTDARALVAAGDVEGAYERIRKGREEYRVDTRLEQFEASLLKESAELKLRKDRTERLAELAAARQRMERNPDSDKARRVIELSRDLGSSAPDDPEAMRGIADAEQTVKRLLGDAAWTSLSATDAGASAGNGRPAAAEDERTRLYAGPAKKAGAKAPSTPSEVKKPERTRGPLLPIGMRARLMVAGAVSAVVLLIVGTSLLLRHPPKAQPEKEPVTERPAATAVKVHIAPTPADSTIRVDGVPVSGNELTILPDRMVRVEVSRAGFKTKSLMLDGKSASVPVALDPQALRVAVATNEKSGVVELDGSRAGELTDGSFDGLDVDADGKSHTLAVLSGGKRVLSLGFRAVAGERPQLDGPMASKDVLVVASLGTAATIYGGEHLKNAAIGGKPVRLSNGGTALPPLTETASELTFQDGSEPASLALTPTDGPALTLHALGAGASITITTNGEGATLTANGKPVRRGRHGWQITEPGTYAFVLAADKFESQSWTTVLKPRQSLSETRNLTPKAGPAQPLLAALVIAGGTPGAQVEVDGKRAGELDGNGAAALKGLLAEGRHQVLLRKDGFCSGRPDEVSAKPPAEVRLNAAKLEACGNVTLKLAQPGTVKLRKSGEPGAREIELAAGKRQAVPAGVYDMTAEASGFATITQQITLKAGGEAELVPQFKPLRPSGGCALQNANEVTAQGEWLKPNGGGLVYLSPGCVNVTLTFAKPKGGILGGRRKMEWVLNAGGGSGQIDYELEGDKLTRKVSAHGTLDKVTLPVEKKLNVDGDTYRVRLRVEGQRVRVLGEGGDAVDDYTAQDPQLVNLRGGRVGVKTSAEFKFSGGGS